MLTAALTIVAPGAEVLEPGGLLTGGLAEPALGLAGLAATAVFVALFGFTTPAAPALAGDPSEDDEVAGLAEGFGRTVATLCAVAFLLMAALAGGLAWLVWEGQGPARAIGLTVVALASLVGALHFGLRAMRGRGSRQRG